MLGVELTRLSEKPADHLGISVDGPYTPKHDRYGGQSRLEGP